MNTENLWNNFLEKIKSQLSSLSYETWFKDTKLHKLEGNVAIVIVPMSLHKKHLEENYKEEMEKNFNELTGTNFNFIFKLEEEVENNTNDILIEDVSSGVPFQSSIDANLKSDYTFDNFIVGESNRFAFTASRAVAEKPGKAYNPLFLYGKSGLGKTHLMHAIGNYILQTSNKKVLYVTSETFVNDYIQAVRYNDKLKNNFDKIDNFKNKYRNVDVLIIDDIQFLGSADKGQEEFFHTFNELYNLNKQIIIASDRSVDDLKSLENRLLTRFSWGLTANITPPDFAMRVDIIRKKILYQETANDIDNDVIEYIANNYDSDVRQLEGAITRVFAYSSMMNHGILNLDIAIEALKDELKEKSIYKNDVHRIQRIVADYFKLDVEELKGKKRNKTVNMPRQIAIYLCRTNTTESYPKIGTYFGGRDHSTIISSYKKIEKELRSNKQLSQIVDEIKNLL